MIGRIQLRILRLQVRLYKPQRNHGDPEAQARKPRGEPLKPWLPSYELLRRSIVVRRSTSNRLRFVEALHSCPLYWPF
jgi:hypothetical protein